MTKENQKRLYEHYKKMSEGDGKLDHFTYVDVVKRAKENVAMMLKAYPEFAEVPKSVSKK